MKLRACLALGFLFAAPASAAAQCLLCGDADPAARSASRPAEAPLRVEVDTQLDFSRVAVGAAGGTVDLDPLSGARRLSGDVIDLGGFAVTGTVTVRGEPGAAVRVLLPAAVDLEGGYGRSARVTGLVTDLAAAPRLGPDGRLQFRFGGRLRIAGLDDGDYRGRIPVTVEYQ